MLGPTTRAMLKPLELSAIAPGRSSRPTSSTTKRLARRDLERVDDAVDRRQNEQPRDVDVVAPGEPPEHGTPVWQNAIWPIFTRRSFSVAVGDDAGVQREQRARGAIRADATRPTRKALFESSNASHPCAIVCIHVPMSDTRLPDPEQPEVPVPLEGLERIERRTTVLAAGVSTAADVLCGAAGGGAVVGSVTIEKYSRRSADWRRTRSSVVRSCRCPCPNGDDNGDSSASDSSTRSAMTEARARGHRWLGVGEPLPSVACAASVALAQQPSPAAGVRMPVRDDPGARRRASQHEHLRAARAASGVADPDDAHAVRHRGRHRRVDRRAASSPPTATSSSRRTFAAAIAARASSS